MDNPVIIEQMLSVCKPYLIFGSPTSFLGASSPNFHRTFRPREVSFFAIFGRIGTMVDARGFWVKTFPPSKGEKMLEE